MIAPRTALLGAAIVLTPPVHLLAQQEERPVVPGDRVRVRAPAIDRDPVVGTLVVFGADTCVLQVEGGDARLTLPIASLVGLEVSRGKKSNTLKGLGIGVLAGAGAGLVVTYGIAGRGGDEDDYWPEIWVPMFAGAGLLVGTTIGAITRSERWKAVPLDWVRVGIAPSRNGGLGIRVSLAFWQDASRARFLARK